MKSPISMQWSFATIAALFVASTANAVPVRWDVQAYFQGGGEAHGAFTVDVDTGQAWDVNVVTTAGDAECFSEPVNTICQVPGVTYTNVQLFFHTYGETKDFEGFTFIEDLSAPRGTSWEWGADLIYEGDSEKCIEDFETCLPGNRGGLFTIYEDSYEIRYAQPSSFDEFTLRWLAHDNDGPLNNTLVGTVVPLPGAFWLLGTGLGYLGWRRISSRLRPRLTV